MKWAVYRRDSVTPNFRRLKNPPSRADPVPWKCPSCGGQTELGYNICETCNAPRPGSEPDSETLANNLCSSRRFTNWLNSIALEYQEYSTYLAVRTTVSVVILGEVFVCWMSGSIIAALFIASFLLGPLAVTAILACMWPSSAAQSVLSLSSICYAVWFVLACVLIFTSPSSTASIGMLFVGLYAIPVLVIFWFVAGIKQQRATS